MFGIFVADDTCLLRNLPVYRQVRIVQQYTSVGLRMVQIVTFIGKDSRLAQYGETVCKALWHKELPFILFAQLDAEPLAESRTAFAQIDRYVQHTTDGTTHQFGLGIRGTLEMQTAHHTVTRTRLIVLHKLRLNTCFAVSLLIVRLYEITSRISEYVWLDNQ